MSADGRPVIAITTNLERDADYLFPGYVRVALNEDYHRSVAAAGGVPVLLPPMADTSTLPTQLSCADALIIAGGQDVDPLRYGQSPRIGTQPPSTVRDTFELAALDEAARRGLPILAICRGVQLLNVWRGGTLHQDTSHAGTDLRHAGLGEPEAGAHPVEVADGSWLHSAIGRRELIVNSFHHQAIDRLGEGVRVVAKAPDGIVEAVQVATDRGPIVGVQWHPEMSSRVDPDSQAVFGWFIARAAEARAARTP